jgi:hypothetical protein
MILGVIIVGVIVVAVALALGIMLLSGQNSASSQDAIISDLKNIGEDAHQFKVRPVSMGGGSGSYAGYVIPSAWGVDNPNATYSIQGTPTATLISFIGTSRRVSGAVVTISFDEKGNIVGFPIAVGF